MERTATITPPSPTQKASPPMHSEGADEAGRALAVLGAVVAV